MSRNLCRTTCVRCESDVTLLETIRLATEADVRHYAFEYADKLWVAKAECGCCGARYLAWCAKAKEWRDHRGWLQTDHSQWMKVDAVCDLSFLSTFDDEDGPGDLPPWNPPAMAIKITGACTPAESVAAVRYLMSIAMRLKPTADGDGYSKRHCDHDGGDRFWVYAWREMDGTLHADVRGSDGIKREVTP